MRVLERVAALRAREDRVGPAAARGLGVFSLGLGLAGLIAPGALKGALGLRHPTNEVVRTAFGARDFGLGAALLAQPHRPEWMWARVAGDALDIGTLIAGDRSDNPNRRALRSALAGVLAVTAADVALALRLGRPEPATGLFGRELPGVARVRGAAGMMGEHLTKNLHLTKKGRLTKKAHLVKKAHLTNKAHLAKKVLPAAVL
ncbi:MAG: hypothetical protein KY449_07385, partial [Proteobacteria bacterium]|nr:hypothetical protein [Pseudomonadota bacterium]